MQYPITTFSPLAVRRFKGLRNIYVGCISNMLGIFLNVQVNSLKKENSPYGLNNVMLIDLEGSMITNLRCLHICELTTALLAIVIHSLYLGVSENLWLTSAYMILLIVPQPSVICRALWESFQSIAGSLDSNLQNLTQSSCLLLLEQLS